MKESVPTFLMQGNRIAEVYYTDWVSDDGGFSWAPDGMLQMPVTHKGDGVLVFESPVGCFMMDLGRPVYPGDSIELLQGPGGDKLAPCHLDIEGFVEERPSLLQRIKRLVAIG